MRTAMRLSMGCCLVGITVVTLHCGTSDSGFSVDDRDASVDSAVDGAEASPPRDASTCMKHCSEDLSKILDCTGAVIETCQGTQGCGGGSCVPACDASNANFTYTGCEFFVPRPVTLDPTSLHALLVTNVWRSPATLSVSFDGQSLPLVGHIVRAADGTPIDDGKIAPGETAIVALAGNHGPPEPMIVEDHLYVRVAGANESGTTHAFQITADVPVQIHDNDALVPTADDVYSKAGALLGATSFWGRDYVVAMPTPESRHGGLLQLVAREETAVEIRPTTALLGSPELPGVAAGEARSYRLGRGEVLQFVQDDDLTGSTILADKPIGVVGGAVNFMVIQQHWESTHFQLPPTRGLGNRYVAVRHRDRYENTPEKGLWRIVGSIAGTVLRYAPDTPAGAPTTLEPGQFFEFETSDPFIVSSQDEDHPFGLYGYMTPARAYVAPPVEVDSELRGDPEFTPMIPTIQYMKQYRFWTDPFFPETNVVVVRRRGSNGFAEVVLDCAGNLAGWSPIGPDGDTEFTRVDLSRGNYEPQGNCKNGVHEMHSDAPFTATVWGWGTSASGGAALPGVWTLESSYAFPVGAGFRPVEVAPSQGEIK